MSTARLVLVGDVSVGRASSRKNLAVSSEVVGSNPTVSIVIKIVN